MIQKIGKIICALVLALVIFIAANGTINLFYAYNPKSEQAVSVSNLKGAAPISQDKIRILSFNTGYASLGEEADSKKEGGRGKRADVDVVLKNARGISELVNLSNSDAVMLQSVDIDSYRSRYVDQLSYYLGNASFSSAYATDHKTRSTSFLPPYKKVTSGVLTLSKREITSAKRVSLPNPKGISATSARRCMLVTEFSIENSSKKLILINFELDAYLSDEAKKEQTAEVIKYAEKAAENGDYVIAAGSFYRSFDDTRDRYPLSDRLRWKPTQMSFDELPAGLTLCYDPTVPTSRILSAPYDRESEERHVYVSDGYILSSNLQIDMIVTVDQEFRYSSHNPILLEVTLK